ncbi:MAG: hypothetical protein ACK48X_10145, partial [Planctomycetota bacterium]
AIVPLLQELLGSGSIVGCWRAGVILGHTVGTKQDGEKTETQTAQGDLEHGKSPWEKAGN